MQRQSRPEAPRGVVLDVRSVLFRGDHAHWFPRLEDARREIAAWRVDYNNVRPHSSLGLKTPAQYRARLTEATDRNQAQEVAELLG